MLQYTDACNCSAAPTRRTSSTCCASTCATEGRDDDTVEKTVTLGADLTNGPSALVDQLRGLHELGFTIAHLVTPGPTPLDAVETIGAAVTQGIATWSPDEHGHPMNTVTR